MDGLVLPVVMALAFCARPGLLPRGEFAGIRGLVGMDGDVFPTGSGATGHCYRVAPRVGSVSCALRCGRFGVDGWQQPVVPFPVEDECARRPPFRSLVACALRMACFRGGRSGGALCRVGQSFRIAGCATRPLPRDRRHACGSVGDLVAVPSRSSARRILSSCASSR